MRIDADCKIILRVIFLSILIPVGNGAIRAQGINYPVGNPTATSGAGNARTDPDNLFIRNNVAGMTELRLDDEAGRSGIPASAVKGRWRSMGEIQLSTYKYSRERILPGPALGVMTQTNLGIPGLAGEITYTSADHRYALGLGAYTIYGFQSKLKDPSQLGPLAYTSNGIPDAFVTPGTVNTGGFDLSGGLGKRVFGYWLNIAAAVILDQERTVGPPDNTLFAGKYGGHGAMLGLGWRW